jgi:chemotaxis protein histidine kinase CheA
LKDQLKAQQNTASVEVECQLADASQNLLLEVTALRARLAETKENNAVRERELRAQIRHEYDTLVQGLFSTIFDLNNKMDEIR